MLNVYDDTYESHGYTCCGCDQKEHLLKEAGIELALVMDSFSKMKQSQSEIEQKLMDSMENACHMLGIKFMGSV